MSSYKVVDVDRLDSDLAAVADTIRSRTGISGVIAFPDGFIRAVEEYDYLGEVMNKQCTHLASVSMTGALSGYFQRGNNHLLVVDLPGVTEMQNGVFQECTNLSAVNLPGVITMGSGSFQECHQLSEICMPALTTITGWGWNFGNCKKLEKACFPNLTTLLPYDLSDCSVLTTVILGSDTMCQLADQTTFRNTPIASGSGYIYVPGALVNAYKGDATWSIYANQIRAIEDYPAILEDWD